MKNARAIGNGNWHSFNLLSCIDLLLDHGRISNVWNCLAFCLYTIPPYLTHLKIPFALSMLNAIVVNFGNVLTVEVELGVFHLLTQLARQLIVTAAFDYFIIKS